MIPGAQNAAVRWRRPTDPLFSSVKWLLPFERGGTGSFYDYSMAHRISTTLEVTQAVSAKYGASGVTLVGSGFIDATSAFSDFKFMHDGTGWTVEGWYANDFAVERYLFVNAVSTANSGVFMSMTTGRQVYCDIYRSVGGTQVVTGLVPGTLPNDYPAKHYLRVVWDFSLGSNNLKVYCDGVLIGQNTKTANAPSAVNPASGPTVGNRAVASAATLYLDDYRVTAATRTDNSAVPFEALPIW